MTRSITVFILLFAICITSHAQELERKYVFVKSIGFGQQDGQIKNPGATAKDANDNVYVVERGNHRIHVFNSSGEFVRKWGSFGNGPGNFNEPSAIALDLNGNVYVSDTRNYRIQIFTNAGVYSREIKTESSPYGIALDKAGNIYVVQRDLAKVRIYSNDGKTFRDIGSMGNGDGQFSLPIGIALDKEERIFVVDEALARVQVFSNQGTFVMKFGNSTGNNSVFQAPGSVAIHDNGEIYVSDRFLRSVQVFDKQGVLVRKISVNSEIYSVMLNNTQTNVLLADYLNSTIQVRSLDGTVIKNIGYKGIADLQFDFPDVVKMDKEGKLVIFDRNNSQLQFCSTDGTFIKKMNIKNGSNRFFSDLAFDSQNNIYVIVTSRIMVYNPSGALLRTLGSETQSAVDGQFDFPYGIVIDKDDKLYVADTQNFRIQVLTKEGEFIAKFGSRGKATTENDYLYGITLGNDENLYMTDGLNARVNVYKTSGTVIRNFGKSGTADGEFLNPYGIARDKEGNVFVTDTKLNNVQVFSSEGKFITKFGTTGSKDGEFNSPQSIAVDASGNVYVADSYNNRIQVFEPKDVPVEVVGLEEEEKQTIYPNPAKDILWINSTRVKQVSFIDPVGRTVLSEIYSTEKDKTSLHVSDLPRGMYLLRVKSNDGQNTTQRIVLN